MPTYEYSCGACDHEFEAFQPITAAPIDICPNCESSKVERLISGGGGVLFKGSGFYATDYRSQNYQDKSKAESSSANLAKADSKSKKEKKALKSASAASD